MTINMWILHLIPPLQINVDPIGDVVKLDNLFNIESLGIEENSISVADTDLIAEFERSVELNDSKYYVELLWKPDVVYFVENNFSIARAVHKPTSTYAMENRKRNSEKQPTINCSLKSIQYERINI